MRIPAPSCCLFNAPTWTFSLLVSCYFVFWTISRIAGQALNSPSPTNSKQQINTLKWEGGLNHSFLGSCAGYTMENIYATFSGNDQVFGNVILINIIWNVFPVTGGLLCLGLLLMEWIFSFIKTCTRLTHGSVPVQSLFGLTSHLRFSKLGTIPNKQIISKQTDVGH